MAVQKTFSIKLESPMTDVIKAFVMSLPTREGAVSLMKLQCHWTVA